MRMLIAERLSYCPETGVLTWRNPDAVNMQPGAVAGSIGGNGYRQIHFQGRKYVAHRVIWFMMTGELPPNVIDHKNRDRLDNRWSNLRAATISQNAGNQPGKGRFPKGVTFHQQMQRYQAQIKKDGKNYYLGLFDSPEEAAAAYIAAANELYGEFASAA
jgi:hypothetical protein